MIYLAVFLYVLLLILCLSLCKISSESDKNSYYEYHDLMARKALNIYYDASDEEWARFLKELEDRILNEDEEEDEINEAFMIYGNILQGHQDQS